MLYPAIIYCCDGVLGLESARCLQVDVFVDENNRQISSQSQGRFSGRTSY